MDRRVNRVNYDYIFPSREPKKKFKKITEAQKKQIEEMVRDGFTGREIIDKLNIGQTAFYGFCRREGIRLSDGRGCKERYKKRGKSLENKNNLMRIHKEGLRVANAKRYHNHVPTKEIGIRMPQDIFNQVVNMSEKTGHKKSFIIVNLLRVALDGKK